jgi:hypothetical protein
MQRRCRRASSPQWCREHEEFQCGSRPG